MRPDEVHDLDPCVICGKPVRRGIEVESEAGGSGLACKPCLRLSRRAVFEQAK